MKWYIACSGVSLATGGSTPKASQVRKMMSVGCPATQGILALRMYSMRVRPARVLRDRGVVEVHVVGALRRRTHVLEHGRPEAQRVEDLGSLSGVRSIALA
jgi:hypothetical protein